jgi:hypothetical protein
MKELKIIVNELRESCFISEKDAYAQAIDIQRNRILDDLVKKINS